MLSLIVRRWISITAALLVFAVCLAPASAIDVPPADLEAAVRTLGFLDSMQRHSPITVGVLYKSGDPDSKSAAQKAASILGGLPGPYSSKISANVITAGDLAQAKHMDVIYVVPGASEGRAIGEFARRQRVLSISNDPACLNAQCCALVVRAGARTDITLDTAMAHDSGATFSSLFMMMVKRR